MTGGCADFSEPSSEALPCSLDDVVLTRLLVSVSVSDCELRRGVEGMRFNMTVFLWVRLMKACRPQSLNHQAARLTYPKPRSQFLFSYRHWKILVIPSAYNRNIAIVSFRPSRCGIRGAFCKCELISAVCTGNKKVRLPTICVLLEQGCDGSYHGAGA